MRLDIELNVRGLEAISKDRYLALVEKLNHLEKLIMTTSAEFTAGFARIDAATTQIAERLRTLSTNLGNMSAEEETAAAAQLDALATTLEAMAADPADPVPVVVPEEPTP